MKTVTIGSVIGTGRNVTAAREHAEAQIRKAYDGSYDPILIKAGETVAILYRNPWGGWHHAMIKTDKIGTYHVRGCSMHGDSPHPDEARSAATRLALAHVAQAAWKLDGSGAVDDAGRPLLDSDSAQAEMRSWTVWQRRYAAHRAAGRTDFEAHALASRGEEA